ncbi:MAG: nuclear transport factor 2 family protein [Candidatus Omnitrophica bacterium]|nr:nuclear transport factor 2 family protein [Candidatus Omnitrophota bacterium]
MNKKVNYGKILSFIFLLSIFVFPNAARAEGELKSVYRQYTAAINNLDVEQFKQNMAAEVVAKVNATTQDQIRSEMEAMKRLSNKDVAVIEEKIDEDKGVLSLTGTNNLTGIKQNGTVYLAKENGQWKIKKEVWSNPGN